MTTMRTQKFYDFNTHAAPECENTPEELAMTVSGYGYAGIAIANHTPHPPRAPKITDHAGIRIYSGIEIVAKNPTHLMQIIRKHRAKACVLSVHGGSEYYQVYGCAGGSVPLPPPDPQRLIDSVRAAIGTGRVTSAHDVSNGGIAVALSEMAQGNGIGADIDLTDFTDPDVVGGGNPDYSVVLFSESHGRVILATPDPGAVIRELRGVPHRIIGTVGGDELRIKLGGDGAVVLPLHEIAEARESITRMMR